MQLSAYYLVFTIFVVTICLSNVFSRCLDCQHYSCKTHLQNSDDTPSSSQDDMVGSADIFTDSMQTEIIGGGQFVNMNQNRRCRNNFIGLKRHPFNEKYYYICQSDRIVVGKCKERFSPIYKRCVTNENKTEPSTDPTECSISGIFPNPRDSQYYYTCEFVNDNFIKQNYKCPEDKIFEVAAKRCIEIQKQFTQIANCSLPGNCSTEINSAKRLPKSLLSLENPPRKVSKIIKKRRKEFVKNLLPSISLYDSYKPKDFIDVSSGDDSDSSSHSQYCNRCSPAKYDPSVPRCLSCKNTDGTKPSSFETTHANDDSDESSDKYDSSSENYDDKSNNDGSNNNNKGGANGHNKKGSKDLCRNSKEIMDSGSESQEKGTDSETNSESDMSIDDSIISENESSVSSDYRNRKTDFSTEEENNFRNSMNIKNKSSDGNQNDSRHNEKNESASEHNEADEKPKKNDNNRPKVKDRDRENHHGLEGSNAANQSDKDETNKSDNRRKGTKSGTTYKPSADQEATDTKTDNNDSKIVSDKTVEIGKSNGAGNHNNSETNKMSGSKTDSITDTEKSDEQSTVNINAKNGQWSNENNEDSNGNTESKENAKVANYNTAENKNQNKSIKSEEERNSRAKLKEESERTEENNADFETNNKTKYMRPELNGESNIEHKPAKEIDKLPTYNNSEGEDNKRNQHDFGELNENAEKNNSESIAISSLSDTETDNGENGEIENSSNDGIETKEGNHQNTILPEQPDYLPNISFKTDEDLGDKNDNDPKINRDHYDSPIKMENKNDISVQTNMASENWMMTTLNQITAILLKLTTIRNDNESSTDNNKENQGNKTDDNTKADNIKYTHSETESIREYENDDRGLVEVKQDDNQSENVSDDDKTSDTGSFNDPEQNSDMYRPQKDMGTNIYSEKHVEPSLDDNNDPINISKAKSNQPHGGEISGPIEARGIYDSNKEIPKDHSRNTDNLSGYVKNADNTSEHDNQNKNESSKDNSGRMVNTNTEDGIRSKADNKTEGETAAYTRTNNEEPETDSNSAFFNKTKIEDDVAHDISTILTKANEKNSLNNINLENNSRNEYNTKDTNNPGGQNHNPEESNPYEQTTKNHSGGDAANTPDKVEEVHSNTDAQGEQPNIDRNINRVINDGSIKWEKESDNSDETDKTSENSTNGGTETNDDNNINIDNPDTGPTTITKNNESFTEINKEIQGNETENNAEFWNQEEKSKSDSIGDLSKTTDDDTKANGDNEPPEVYEHDDSTLAEGKVVDNNQNKNVLASDNKDVSGKPDNVPTAGNHTENTNLKQIYPPEKDTEIDLYSEKGPEPVMNGDTGKTKTTNKDNGGNESNRPIESNDLYDTDREIGKDQKDKTNDDTTTHSNKVSKIDASDTSTDDNAPGFVENADNMSDPENQNKPKSSNGTADNSTKGDIADEAKIDEKNIETDSTSGSGNKSELKQTNYEEVGNEAAKETKKSPTVNKNLENDRGTEDNMKDQNNSGDQPDAIGGVPNSEPDKDRKSEIENDSKRNNNLPNINSETDKDGDNSSTKQENKSDESESNDDNTSKTNKPDSVPTTIRNDNESSKDNGDSEINNSTKADSINEAQSKKIIESTKRSDTPDDGTEPNSYNLPASDYDYFSQHVEGKKADNPNENVSEINDQNALGKLGSLPNADSFNISNRKSKDEEKSENDTPSHINNASKTNDPETPADGNVPGYVENADNTSDHLGHNKNESSNSTTDNNIKDEIADEIEIDEKNIETDSIKKSGIKNENKDMGTNEEEAANDELAITKQAPDINSEPNNEKEKNPTINESFENESGTINNMKDQNSSGDQDENLDGNNSDKNDVLSDLSNNKTNKSEIENNSNGNIDIEDLSSQDNKIKNENDETSDPANRNDKNEKTKSNTDVKSEQPGIDPTFKKGNDNSSSKQEDDSEDRTNNETKSYKDNNSETDKPDTEPPIVGNNNESSADNSKGNDYSETGNLAKTDNINEPPSRKDVQSKTRFDKPDGNRSVDSTEANNDNESLENYENDDNEFVEIKEEDNQSDDVSENDSKDDSDKPGRIVNAANETDNGSSNDRKTTDGDSYNGSKPTLDDKDYSIKIFDTKIRNEDETEADRPSEATETEREIEKNQKDTTYTGDGAPESSTADNNTNIAPSFVENVDNTSGSDNQHKNESTKYDYIGTPDSDGNNTKPDVESEDEVYDADNDGYKTENGELESPTPPLDNDSNDGNDSTKQDDESETSSSKTDSNHRTHGTEPNNDNEPLGNYESDDTEFVEIKEVDNQSDDVSENGNKNDTDKPGSLANAANETDNGSSNDGKATDGDTYNDSEPTAKTTEPSLDDNDYFINVFDTKVKNENQTETTNRPAETTETERENENNEKDTTYTGDIPTRSNGVNETSTPESSTGDNNTSFLDNTSGTDHHDEDESNKHNSMETPDSDGSDGKPYVKTEDDVYEVVDDNKAENGEPESITPPPDINRNNENDSTKQEDESNEPPQFDKIVHYGHITNNNKENEGSETDNNTKTDNINGAQSYKDDDSNISDKPKDILILPNRDQEQDKVTDQEGNSDNKHEIVEVKVVNNQREKVPNDDSNDSHSSGPETDSDRQRNNVTEPAVENNNKSINVSDAKNKNKVKSESENPNEAGLLANIAVRLPLSIINVNIPTKQAKTESSKHISSKTAKPYSDDDNDANDDMVENPDGESDDDTEPGNKETETDSINEKAKSDNENENDDAGTGDDKTTNSKGLVNSSNSTLKNSPKQNTNIPQNKPGIIKGAVKDVVKILPILLR